MGSRREEGKRGGWGEEGKKGGGKKGGGWMGGRDVRRNMHNI